ncbi:MAG: OsmC family protein [Hyphomicrobium sp.]
MSERKVTVVESGNGPYGQFVTAGRHVLGSDEPVAAGGQGTGPDPYELVLAGLGSCTAMTLRMYASRKGIKLTRVAVHLRHVQRASQAKGLIDRFERLLELEGDLTPDDRQKLLDIAERCPVSQTLKRSSDIETREKTS